jgi:hypothetical protein
VYRLLKILEIRPPSSHTERRRIYEEGVYEFWTLKSSVKVPTIDGNACDSAVIIVLQVQFLYTCNLKHLKVFIPYLGGEEVYDWILDQRIDSHCIVQVWRVEKTYRLPLSRQYMTILGEITMGAWKTSGVDENGEEGWGEMEEEKARRKEGRGRRQEQGAKKHKTK